MLKIKEFFKKYGLFVVIGVVLLIFFVVVISLLGEEKKEDGVVAPTEILSEFKTVKQPLGHHKNYNIDLSTSVFNQIAQKEDKYFGFKIKEVDHLEKSKDFIKKIDKGHLEYTKSEPSPEAVTHYWQDEDNSISYNSARDSLFAKFEQPIYIPDINLNPREEKSLEGSLQKLSNEIFSLNYEYQIEKIKKEGNFQRVEFSRVLEGIPLYVQGPGEYLLLTPDGRLKEMSFLLTEFERYEGLKYSLIDAEELKKNIAMVEYPKTVEFKILDLAVEEEYEPYGYIVFTEPFTQEGSMELTDMEVVYFYDGQSQEVIVPTFLFKGEGLLDVEGSPTRSEYKVLASAIDSGYIYVYPPSYFDELKGIE